MNLTNFFLSWENGDSPWNFVGSKALFPHEEKSQKICRCIRYVWKHVYKQICDGGDIFLRVTMWICVNTSCCLICWLDKQKNDDNRRKDVKIRRHEKIQRGYVFSMGVCSRYCHYLCHYLEAAMISWATSLSKDEVARSKHWIINFSFGNPNIKSVFRLLALYLLSP